MADPGPNTTANATIAEATRSAFKSIDRRSQCVMRDNVRRGLRAHIAVLLINRESDRCGIWRSFCTAALAALIIL